MNVREFPGCCTAKVLTQFGEERAAEFRTGIPEDNTPENLQRILGGYKRGGVGMVTAILTQNQTHGIELLEGAGFKSTGWVSKGAHPENKIALFYLSLEDWKPKKLNSGWIRNRGSKSVPKKVRGKRIIVRDRNGDRSFVGQPAESFNWTCNGLGRDIMAYKIVGGE